MKLRRQWQLARARVALAACSLATEHFSARGGPDVVLGYRFRLPAANLHDLIHRRPGQRFAEGTTHAEGECIVKWLGSPAARKWACKAIVIRAAGSGRLLRSPPAVTTGNRCPAVKSHPIRCEAEMYAVTSRNAQTAEQSRSPSTTTASLEALSVVPNSKLKISPLEFGSFKISSTPSRPWQPVRNTGGAATAPSHCSYPVCCSLRTNDGHSGA